MCCKKIHLIAVCFSFFTLCFVLVPHQAQAQSACYAYGNSLKNAQAYFNNKCGNFGRSCVQVGANKYKCTTSSGGGSNNNASASNTGACYAYGNNVNNAVAYFKNKCGNSAMSCQKLAANKFKCTATSGGSSSGTTGSSSSTNTNTANNTNNNSSSSTVSGSSCYGTGNSWGAARSSYRSKCGKDDLLCTQSGNTYRCGKATRVNNRKAINAPAGGRTNNSSNCSQGSTNGSAALMSYIINCGRDKSYPNCRPQSNGNWRCYPTGRGVVSDMTGCWGYGNTMAAAKSLYRKNCGSQTPACGMNWKSIYKCVDRDKANIMLEYVME